MENEDVGKLLVQVLLAVIRHGLTVAGVHEALVSGDTLVQLASAGVAFGGLLWSFYRKLQTARRITTP